MFSYKVIHGSIYLMDDDKPYIIIEKPAALIDKCTGTVHKTGELSIVQAKYDQIIEKDASGIISGDLVLFEFDMDVWSKERAAEKLDKMLGISDYAGVFLKRLERNQMITQ